MEESSCRMDEEEEEEETDFSSSCSDDAGSDVIDGAIPADRLTFHDESSSSSSSNGGGGMLIRLHEESNEYALLKHRFYLSIGSLSLSKNYTTVVVAAHRNLHYSAMKKAQVNSFRMFLKAMEDKCQGNANVMHAYWYATSKDESLKIITNGFRVSGKPEQEEEEEDGTGSFGFGLYLYPDRSACQSLVSSPVDEDGLRHVVVCRVILGRSEVIPPGSKQCGPSCENFDSGVDNLQSPSKYIVWYPDVKTNILPLYALTVKLDNYFHSPQGSIQREPTRQPSSPWMPFTALLCRLSKFLSPSAMCLIRRSHTDFLERKISRQQFVQRVRQLTGDKLLVHAIRDFQDKRMKAIARDTT